MDPWLETIAVSLIAVLGIALGRMFSGLKKSYWLYGYFLSCLLIAVLLAARFSNTLSFLPPFSWIIARRVKFVVLSLAVTMGLTAVLSRLTRRFEKLIICVLMTGFVFWFSVLPFLVPALIRDELSNLQTKLDSNGVCLQTRDYTCGPAAAVTALRRLGLPANEGEIAILAHTSPVAGTLPGSLCAALRNRYRTQGLDCRYRRFDSVAQLKDAGLTLVVLRDAFLLNHCVAVLEVSDRDVIVADPVLGRKLMSHQQFARQWRFSGIVLKRDLARSI